MEKIKMKTDVEKAKGILESKRNMLDNVGGAEEKYLIAVAYQIPYYRLYGLGTIGQFNDIKTLNKTFSSVEQVLFSPEYFGNLCQGYTQKIYNGKRQNPITKEEINELEKVFDGGVRNIEIYKLRLEKITGEIEGAERKLRSFEVK